MSNQKNERITFANRLRVLNEKREAFVKHFAPSSSDYGFGGAHRCWVKECGMATAREYIRMAKEMEEYPVSPVYKLAIPMPPQWNGVRPEECKIYGHPHSAFKDARHFTEGMVYELARNGYIAEWEHYNDYKDLVIVADTMVRVAKYPIILHKEEFEGKENTNSASTPSLPFEEFCREIEEIFKGSVIAEQKEIVDEFPYFLRPIIAMSLCKKTEQEMNDNKE